MTLSFLGLSSYLLLGVGPLLAQQQITKNFSIADGLANNSIRSLYVDSRDFLWIGTENGVSLKRNQEFLNFFMEDGLAFNSCWAITEDAQGKMWFGSYGGGISMFDGKSFHSIQRGLFTQFIRTLHSSRDYIWVGTTNGLNLIHTKTLEVKRVQGSQGEEELSFISGFFEIENRLFFTTYRNGIFEVTESNGTYRAKKRNSYPYIYQIHQEGDNILVSGREAILSFSVQSLISENPVPSHVLESSNFYGFQKTKEFGLIGSATGLYSPNGGVFQIDEGLLQPLNYRFAVESKNLWSIAYHNKQKVLYIGSLDKGLYEVNLSERILLFNTHKIEILGFEGEGKLEAVLQSNGLYIPNKKKFLPKTTFKQAQVNYYKNPQAWSPMPEADFYELNTQLSAEEILFYGIKLHKNTYWINSNAGIYQLSKSGKILRYLPLHSFVIGFTPDGHLIESNPYGGLRIYPNAGQPKNHLYYSSKIPETPEMLSQIIHKNDRTYFSSVFSGLFRFDKNGFFSFKESGLWDIEKIKTVYVTSGNQLVVGAEFGDVYLLEDGDSFKEALKIPKQAIYGNTIVGVLAYQDALLILTEKGLNIYQNGFVKLIDEEQGLKKTIIKSFNLLGDDLYLGYEDGYIKIHLPFLLRDSYQSYELKITKLMVNFEPIQTSQMEWFSYQPQHIVLKKTPTSLVIQIQPHTLLYPKKLQYRYRISSDQEWTPFSKSSEIFLSYLNYGDFSLEVEVLDLDSGKLEYFNLFTIEALPPFYLRTWFVISIIFLSLVTTIIIFKFRINQIRESETIERKMAETKLEALRSQMNPHFIFNAINSIQYFILKNDSEKATQFLNKFSHLVRKTLENSKSNFIKLSVELEYLRAYMAVENERMNNRVQWSINYNESIDPEFIDIPPMMIQPFIENAFVHAFPPSITHPTIQICFEEINRNNITCKIVDNGIGVSVKTQKSHRSRGLELVSERISLLANALPDAITILSEEKHGTTIMVKIPVVTRGKMNKMTKL